MPLLSALDQNDKLEQPTMTKKRMSVTEVELPNLADAPKFGRGTLVYNRGNLAIVCGNNNPVTASNIVHVLANIDPGTDNDNPDAPLVHLPQNYRLCFTEATGQWSTSPSIPPFGPEGLNGQVATAPPYLANEQIGRLVGVTAPIASIGTLVYPYTRRVCWKNTSGYDLNIRFYINDIKGSYADNVGYMNCNIIVMP
jgi:hypothetical protein